MANLNKTSSIIIKKIEKFEYSSFMIGTIIDSEIIEREDFIRAEYKIKGGESIKSEITKQTSKFIALKSGKRVSLNKPDLNILVNTLMDDIEITTRSIFVIGNYIKRKRGVRQKKQRCKECKTYGCKICKFSGFQKSPSVENEIQKFLKKKFIANNVKISWFGSEDNNSLVKNKGRPFCAEIVSPIKRKSFFRDKKMNNGIIMKHAEILKNRPITDFGFIMKSRVNFKCNCKDVNKIKYLEKFFDKKDVTIYSINKRKHFTRKIFSVTIKKIEKKQVRLDIICEGGINIKKLVSGENNEIEPNFNKVIRRKCIPDKNAPFDVHYVRIQKKR